VIAIEPNTTGRFHAGEPQRSSAAAYVCLLIGASEPPKSVWLLPNSLILASSDFFPPQSAVGDGLCVALPPVALPRMTELPTSPVWVRAITRTTPISTINAPNARQDDATAFRIRLGAGYAWASRPTGRHIVIARRAVSGLSMRDTPRLAAG